MPKRPLGASMLDLPAELVALVVGRLPARDVFSLKMSCRLLCGRVGDMLPIAMKRMNEMLDGPPVPFRAACVLKHSIPQPVGARACLYAGKRYEYSWGEQAVLGPRGFVTTNYERNQYAHYDDDGQFNVRNDKVPPWKEYFVEWMVSRNKLLRVLDPGIAKQFIVMFNSWRYVFNFAQLQQNNPAAFQQHSVIGNRFTGNVTVCGKWIVGLTVNNELCWSNADNEIVPCCKIQWGASNQIWLTKYGLLFYGDNERLSRAFVLVPKD